MSDLSSDWYGCLCVGCCFVRLRPGGLRNSRDETALWPGSPLIAVPCIMLAASLVWSFFAHDFVSYSNRWIRLLSYGYSMQAMGYVRQNWNIRRQLVYLMRSFV